MTKTLAVGILLFICTTAGIAGTYAYVHSFPEKATLRFSNTQPWNSDFLNSANSLTAEGLEQIAAMDIPPYPENTSAETQEEIAQMHDMVALRTKEKMDEINAELSVHTMVYGSSTINVLADKTTRPYTSLLIDTTSELAAPYIFAVKKQFDRVRPSYLDPTLETALPVPEHPAYPSGHATQSTLIALVLSELDPENSDAYFASADRIAHNREIAGLHYPSDSRTGQLLGRKLFPILLQNEEYAQLLEHARAEW